MTPIAASSQDKAEMLDGTPWSHDFSWQQLLSLASYMQALQLRAKGTVFREHDRPPYMCVVVTGQVTVLKEDADKSLKELVHIGPGKAFGEIAVIDSQPRSATIVAAQDSKLMVLTQDSLKQLCREQPDLANVLLWKLARVLSGRLRQTSGALVERL